MAVRTIMEGSNPRLRAQTKPVKKITDHILTILDDMIETLHQAQGVGLAAPQIGVLRRIVVIDIGDGPVELINPEILRAEGSELRMEGCLSFPGATGWVERPTHVVFKGMNRHGEEKTYEGTGLMAQAVSHELDHLDGVLFVDRVERWCTEEELNAEQTEEPEDEG